MPYNNGRERPQMYILFDNFNIRFHIEISLKLFSRVTKGWTCPGNNSQALSRHSLIRAPTEDQIHFVVKRLDNAKVKHQIAGDVLYCNQKQFHYLNIIWALKNKLREVIGI